jgi:hypothetical protein
MMFCENKCNWVKVKVIFSLSTPWRHTGGVKVLLLLSLTSVINWDEWLISHPGHLTRWADGPCTHWLESWAHPAHGLVFLWE